MNRISYLTPSKYIGVHCQYRDMLCKWSLVRFSAIAGILVFATCAHCLLDLHILLLKVPRPLCPEIRGPERDAGHFRHSCV